MDCASNTEIVRRMLDAFDRRDRAAWIALHDGEYELIPSAIWPEADPVRGPEPGWDYYVSAVEPFVRQSFSATAEIVDAGPDKVLVHQRIELRGRASGAEVEFDMWVVGTLRGGRIVRDQWFTNRDEAVAAAEG
jgi:ketosteroid isomerase-like protein